MERTNEQKLDLFADLLEPVAEILSDKELAETLQKGGKPIKAVQLAIKNHKKSVIEVLALIDGVNPDDYVVNIISLPVRILNLLNKPELQELFTLQGQKSEYKNSGSATETTEESAI